VSHNLAFDSVQEYRSGCSIIDKKCGIFKDINEYKNAIFVNLYNLKCPILNFIWRLNVPPELQKN